jgi:hypothetical protein
MSLFVECKPDETLALTLGVTRRQIEHAAGKSGVCAQLARRRDVTGLLDEDPGSGRAPYLLNLVEESWEHEVRLLLDEERNNRVVVISPRFENWLVRTAKDAGLNMTGFGFDSDQGIKLHSEINHRLGSLKKLVESLVEKRSKRILRLQQLLLHETNR